MFPTLMWCAPSSAAASKRTRRSRSDSSRRARARGEKGPPPQPGGLEPPLVLLVEEPVHQELELEPAQAVVVEDPLQVAQRSRLEQVLEVGVPDPEPAEADLARLRAAVGPVEEAPL